MRPQDPTNLDDVTQPEPPKPDPDQVIGDRELTAEEKTNAAYYGLSQDIARTYTPRQLEQLAYDWMEHTHRSAGMTRDLGA